MAYEWKSYSSPIAFSRGQGAIMAEEFDHVMALGNAKTADMLAVALDLTPEAEADHFRRCNRCQLSLARKMRREHIEATLDCILDR